VFRWKILRHALKKIIRKCVSSRFPLCLRRRPVLMATRLVVYESSFNC
jgi:hypothetical protein